MITQIKSTWREAPPVLARQDCTICHGTGWQLLSVGGFAEARRCSCGELDRLIWLKELARIPQRYEHCSLENFMPLSLSQVRALAEARRFVDRFPRVRQGLFISGKPGVGKTHLAVGIVRDLMQRFVRDVLFADCALLDEASDMTGTDAQEYEASWDRMESIPLLVLDNFGYSSSAETARRIQELVRRRLNTKKITLYTGSIVHWRKHIALSEAETTSPTQEFLYGFPPDLLTRFINNLKVLPVNGRDFRSRNENGLALFS